MPYKFLLTEPEGAAFYLSILCYITVITIALTYYLPLLRDKKMPPETVNVKTRKIRLRATLGCFITAGLHCVLFLLFFQVFPDKLNPETPPRTSYFISIALTFLFFFALLRFGFYLKGTSTLPKQDGPVSGV